MSPLIFMTVAGMAIATVAAPLAHADPAFGARRVAAETSSGGLVGRTAVGARGNYGTFRGLRGFGADGEGNVAAAGASGFATASGGQGWRSADFNRSAEGTVTANGAASASGANWSADRNGSYTKNADGTASGQRSATATNANTGVTFDASTTYAKGAGVTRSGSCKDAAGTTVTCGAR